MGKKIIPIVFFTEENNLSGVNFADDLENRINNDRSLSSKDKEFLLNYPTVYIHYWKEKVNDYIEKYDVYVGESNNVIGRTKQHYESALENDKWQNLLLSKTPNMLIVGHPHFNKSFTLDVENQLILYVSSMQTVNHLHNGRTNPQNDYYPRNEFNSVFSEIWQKLREKNDKLFVPEEEVKKSAIYKASPLHRLTTSQLKIKRIIIEKIIAACKPTKKRVTDDCQLILVQGEAGTGKTVLTSSTFYDLIEKIRVDKLNIDCHLLVNHNEQYNVYDLMTKKLNINKECIWKPTKFINEMKKRGGKKVDVVFVDESHLLYTQGNMGFRMKGSQLDMICQYAKVVVLMFDEHQILSIDEYISKEQLRDLIQKSKKQKNYIQLTEQLRMSCSADTVKWINDFVYESKLQNLKKDKKGFEIKSFDCPGKLERAILEKASTEKYKLSRIVATYDWEFKNESPEKKKYWEVEIKCDDCKFERKWSSPWNYQLEKDFDKKEKKKINGLAWAEQPQTIREVGSTFTIQGFDLAYAGVILGPSVRYENGKVVFDSDKNCYSKATQERKGAYKNFNEELIRNQVNILMKRGVNGLYIYACDKELRKKLKEVLPK